MTNSRQSILQSFPTCLLVKYCHFAPKDFIANIVTCQNRNYKKKVLIKEAITTELISTTIYNNTAPGPSQYIFLVPVPTHYSYKQT